MALKITCSQTRLKQLEVEKFEREINVEKDNLRQLSHCPACYQEYDVTLMLPCSHTMCGRCVAAGESTSSDLPLCSVACPCCRHPVELPCWTWSSAASCLPNHPAVSPACVRRETGSEEESSRHVQSDSAEEAAEDCLYGSSAASAPVRPVDGAVDLREEDMERSVHGLCFALDPSSAPPSLHLSNSSHTVTYQGESPASESKFSRSAVTSDPRVFPQVCADVVVAQGQYYWEVDVCNSSMYRIGVISLDGCRSWWLERQGLSFTVVYDGSWEPLYTVPPQIKTLGVFLNIGGGTLSFHNPLTQEHLATLPTCFSPGGVLPAVGLGQGRVRLHCGLPPPPHVFLSKDSAYRRSCEADGGRWRREVSFHSVRKVIQKFEELAVSDCDSGLVSSFVSSCSTLSSLPDLGAWRSGMFPSGHTE